MWVNKNWSLQRLHFEIFKFFSERLHILIDVSSNLPMFSEDEGSNKLKKEQFEKLSL
jgi:hypothetical protein